MPGISDFSIIGEDGLRFCAQGNRLFLSLYEASTRKPTRKMLYERCHEMIDLVMTTLS